MQLGQLQKNTERNRTNKMTQDDTYDMHTCHDNCQRISCVLRRELTAMTKQRDELAEALEDLERTAGLAAMEYGPVRIRARHLLLIPNQTNPNQNESF